METIKNSSDSIKFTNSSNDNTIISYEEFEKIMEDRKNIHIDYPILQPFHICYRPYQFYW